VIADTIVNDVVSLGYCNNLDELEAGLTSQIAEAVLHVQQLEIVRLKQLFAKFARPLLTSEELDAVREAGLGEPSVVRNWQVSWNCPGPVLHPSSCVYRHRVNGTQKVRSNGWNRSLLPNANRL
jgi:hypothetical protein